MYTTTGPRRARRLLLALLVGLSGLTLPVAAHAAPPAAPADDGVGADAGTDSGASETAPSRPAEPEAPGATVVPPALPGMEMSGYRIVDLAGGAPAVSQLDPKGIDDQGRVAGLVVEYGQPRGFAWAPGDGGYSYLEDDAGTVTWIEAIADNGTVAASVFDVDGPDRYVYWRGAESGWESMRVSAQGENLGYGSIAGVLPDGTMYLDAARPAVLSPGGAYTTLPTLNGTARYSSGAVYDVNTSGRAVGWSAYDTDDDLSADVVEGTVWNGGPASAGWPTGSAAGTQARAINDAGDYVVERDAAAGGGTYLHTSTGWELLAQLPGTVWSRVYAINDQRQMVGTAMLADGQHAVLWADGKVVDLNDYFQGETGWRLQSAIDINERGQIVGDGSWNGAATGFFLDPVTPVVFVHGAGASRLSTYDPATTEEGDELWLDCNEGRMQLSLWPSDAGEVPEHIGAFDALQFATCYGFGSWANRALDTYGTFLDGLRTSGYFVEYDKQHRLDTMTTAGCDLDQQSRHPNLFVFAYDWRRDNDINAEQLADFIGCVQQFWPGREVNLVAHSMGSIVSRRLIIDHPELPIERLITVGAPWFGAPKLVNVLQTGDFAPFLVNGPYGIVKHIVQSFRAAHQLMAAARYDEVAMDSVFVEDGWDINGNGIDREEYSWAQLAALLDEQVPEFDPAATATAFQGYTSASGEHQVDWRQDATGVDYTSIVGLQAGRNTIGRVVATMQTVCAEMFCTQEPVIRQELVCGDGTVPHASAIRMGNGLDYNGGGIDVMVFPSSDPSANHWVEHTGLTATSGVRDQILHLLLTDPEDDIVPSPRLGLGGEGQDLSVCMPPPADERQTADGLAPAAAGPNATITDGSLRYISLFNVTDAGISAGPVDAAGKFVWTEDATAFPSSDPDAIMFTVPLSLTKGYDAHFVATGDPLQVEILEGTQQDPSAAIRWMDVDVPAGAAVTLTMSATGTERLSYDSDGDGTVDTTVAPTTSVTGSDALDTDAPTVGIVGAGSGAATRYAVTAADSGSGVARILVSTDGQHFAPFTAPFTAPAGTTAISAFAEDRAGNRSGISTVSLGDVVRTPLTVMTVDPAPAASGWNSGAVQVHFDAVDAAGGDAITSIVVSASGAGASAAQTFAGPSATLPLDAEGVTTFTFHAVAADGTIEATRTAQVRIDHTDPSAVVRTPHPGSVVADLGTVAGTATDASSGVATVEIELRNSAGRWWDGAAWTTSRTWLPTSGSAVWTRAAGMPSGAQLPRGAYRVAVRVTDAAGRTSVQPAVSFTVSPDGTSRVVVLPGPNADLNHTSAQAINDRGVAVGISSGAVPVRWTGGSVSALPAINGVGASTRDVALDGTVVGDSNGPEALVWAPDGSVTALASLPGLQSSDARGINDAGVIVGTSAGVPVRWVGGAVQALPSLGTGMSGTAEDVNAAGVIVGTITSSVGTVGVRWDPSGPVNLGTFGGSTSSAMAINDLGDVVGAAQDQFGHTYAFLHDGDSMVRLDEGLFADSAIGLDVNDRGEVVGEFLSRATRTTRPFLYRPGLGAIDLNTLVPPGSGWVLQSARSINELGQVVGLGTLNGQPRAFLLTALHAPVAEDGSATTTRGTAVDVQVDAWDPNAIDDVTVSIMDAPAHGTAVVVGGTSVRYTPAAGFHGEDTFTYRANDGELDSNVGTVVVTVRDEDAPPAPPVAAVAGPTAVTEGGTISLDGSGSTDADGAIAAFAWDLDGDGAFDDATAPSASVPATDDGLVTVRLRVTDDDGQTDDAWFTVTIANAAPVPTALPSSTSIRLGEPVTFAGTLADAGARDSHTATVDLGSGTGPVGLDLTTGRWSVGHTYAAPGTYVVTVTVCDDDGGCGSTSGTVVVSAVDQLPPGQPGDPGDPGTGTSAEYVPVVPERFLDTRSESAVGYSGPKPGPGAVVEVQVTGVGATQVPADALAVVLNVAGDAASGDGFVTVWPCGTPRPLAANLNLVAGGTRPNLVIAKVGAGGKVCMFTQSGTHLVADVNGWFPATSTYRPVVPERFLDTRSESAVGYSGSKPGPGAVVEVQVTGVGTTQVPADALAVVLNVAGDAATASGFVTVWPCGTPRPLAANLNLDAGGTAPNLVVAKIGAGGKVCMFTQSGTHLVADVNGWFPAGSSPAAYRPVVPERFLDTRSESAVGYSGPKPGAGAVVEVQVTGVGATQVPADALAVVLNVAGDAATASGFVTVWPCGTPRPLAANLNLDAGGTAPNLVVAKIGAGGKVCMFTQSGTHLVADVNGWFPAAP